MSRNRYPTLPGTPAPRPTVPLGDIRTLELLGGGTIPTPQPDVQIMLPEAANLIAQVEKYKVDLPPTAPSVIPRSGQVEWSLRSWFTGLPQGESADIFGLPPMGGRFDLAMAAVLARVSYSGNAEAIDILTQPYVSLSWTRKTVSGNTFLTYDVWTYNRTYAIVVFPGTVSLAQWLTYIAPIGVHRPWMPDGVSAWAGLLAILDTYAADVEATLAKYVNTPQSIVMIGHSAGGAVAEMMAARLKNSQQVAEGGLGLNSPVVATYTFGAPAWAFWNVQATPDAALTGGLRVYNVGDPVVEATQNYYRGIYSAKAGLVTGIDNRAFEESGPKHISQRSAALTDPTNATRRQLRNLVFTGWQGNAFELAAGLTENHSITVYSRALVRQAIDTGSFPEIYGDSVKNANFSMTEAGQ